MVILTYRPGGLFTPALLTGSEGWYVQSSNNQIDFDDEIVPIYRF